MVHVFMTVVPLPAAPSPHAPVFDSVRAHARVMENDRVGHKVQLLRAHDDDGDQLWHSITGKWTAVQLRSAACKVQL